MNLSRMLAKRAEEGRPVRVGIIGAGKFGAMYLSQARLTKGTHVLGIADRDGADTMPAAGLDLDQPLGLELAHGVAHGRFRDAIALREVGLAQFLAGHEAARQDVAPDHLENDIARQIHG